MTAHRPAAKAPAAAILATCAALVASLAATPAGAGELEDCWQQAENNFDRAQCYVLAEAAADDALAAALLRARASAGTLDQTLGRASALPALEAAQSAWLAYREAECSYVGATFGGGSGTAAGVLGCLIELTRARSAELDATSAP